MKPYNERLPLIDSAIENFKDKMPKNAIGVFLSKCDYKPFAVKSIEDSEFMSPASIGDKTDDWDFISANEFNERKRERQNKPKWEDAPEWVDYIAQDRHGIWRGFS